MNLLKSKFFLGALVAVVAIFGYASVSNAAYMHTVTLKMGSNNASVMSLQQTLNMTACNVGLVGTAGGPGTETMYFGAKTLGAVKCFQTANGLASDGIVGPMTAAKLMAVAMGNPAQPGCPAGAMYNSVTGAPCGSTTNLPAGCTSTVGYSPSTGVKCDSNPSTPGTGGGTLSGEGSVKDFSLGSAEESDVSEGQTGVELIAIDVELEDDGSLKLDRFDLYMGQDNTVTASNKPWDYFESVTLLADGNEIASMDVDSSSDWSEYDTGTLGTTSQEYRLRFTGLDEILPSDDTTTITVEFDIVSNIDTADEDAVWQFGTTADSFRFEDATGFVFEDGEDLADSFAFDTALEADLDISSSTDDPDASIIEVDDASDTNGVTIGVFEIEEGEGLDVNITEMTVTLATSDTITDVVKKLYIYEGSTMIGEETVTGLTVTFDNIDFDIDADDTVEVTVKADFDDTNAQVRYQNGDTIQVASVNLTEYEDEMGNDDGDFTETGSFAGNTHTLYSDGVSIEVVGNPTTQITSDENGATFVSAAQFTWVVDITTFGDRDIYINRDVAHILAADGADVEQVYSVEYSGGAVLTGLSGTIVCSSDCTNVTNATGDAGAYGAAYNAETFFKIAKGKSAEFTITVSGVNQTDAKQVRALLNNIEWTADFVETDVTYDASTAAMNDYTVNLGSDAATPFTFIH